MMTRREIAWTLAGIVLYLAALFGTQYLRDAHAQPAPARIGEMDVLVLRHTYDGPVEFTGYLLDFRYGPDAVYVEILDDGDGIFRADFDGGAP